MAVRKSAFLLLSALLSVLAPVDALWPQPKSITTGSSALKLSGGFDITISGTVHNAPQDLHQAVERANSYLRTDKLERLVVGRGDVDKPALGKAKTLTRLTLSLSPGAKVNTITAEAQKPIESRDEAYVLNVPADGSGATLTANSTLGLLRGLTTFGQLWYQSDSTTYTIVAPVHIEDSPAYVRFHLPFFSSPSTCCSYYS